MRVELESSYGWNLRAPSDSFCSRIHTLRATGFFLNEAMSTSVPSFLTRLGKVKTDVSTQVLTFTTDRIGSAARNCYFVLYGESDPFLRSAGIGTAIGLLLRLAAHQIDTQYQSDSTRFRSVLAAL